MSRQKAHADVAAPGFSGSARSRRRGRRATSMAGGSETWASSREIEGGLAPPSAEDDPEGVFGEGLVVDCVSRVGVLAMPADVAVGLNLQGTSEERQRAGEAGTWEFAPSAAELLRSYLAAHPAIVAAVVRSAHSADAGWRPAGRDSGGKSAAFPRRRPAARRGGRGRFPRRRSRWTRRTARGKRMKRTSGKVGARDVSRAAHPTPEPGVSRAARRAGRPSSPEADVRAARDGVAAETFAQDGAKQKNPPHRLRVGS